MNFNRLLSPASLAITCAWFATAIASATAQQPAAPPQTPAAGKGLAQNGLPMWVIRDADSTIYITGTVHVLRDNACWRSEKLDAALNEATELWLELAEIGAPEGFNTVVLSVLEEDFPSDGPDLSSLLSDTERTALAKAYAKANTPPDVIAKAEKIQPWYAIYAIGRGHDIGGDYREENGIDRALAAIASKQGDTIKGLETLEFQMADLYLLSPEEQLEELRWRLNNESAMKDGMARVADLAFGGWTRGEINLVEALATFLSVGSGMDALLADRNEAWAEQIEERLAGSGISLIAVGALHLVGPESLQRRLKLRGIQTERY